MMHSCLGTYFTLGDEISQRSYLSLHHVVQTAINYSRMIPLDLHFFS